jgi:hypothetical protein
LIEDGMNMKKLVLMVGLFFSCMNFVVAMQGPGMLRIPSSGRLTSPVPMSPAVALSYRLATMDDIGKILRLYEGFDADDMSRVVVFPPEVRPQILENSIRKGRMYVACDSMMDPDHDIVAFIKLFIVEDIPEKTNIVTSELRALKSTGDSIEPVDAFFCTLDENFPTNFEAKPEFSSLGLPHKFDKEEMLIYYGGAYTLPRYRHKGVNMLLEQFALCSIEAEVRSCLARGMVHKVTYVYGVVKANASGLGRLRSFTALVCLLARELGKYSEDGVSLKIYRFQAFKPTFYMRGGDIAVQADDHPDTLAGAGLGCFIEYVLPS